MGRLKKNGGDGNVRSGLWIRHEIVNYLYRNPMVSVKIPSSVELARQFGVARCTVTDELKKLIAEGLLIGKRGIGTFTNPESMSFTSKIPGNKVIGILVGDGQFLCHDYTSWVLASAAGKALLPDIGHPVNIELGERIPELICMELSLRKLDGLIWIMPPERMAPHLKTLRKKGMPIVTIYRVFPGVPGIELDFLKQGRDIAETLIREGKIRVGWCAFDQWACASRSEAQEVFTVSGISVQGWTEWKNPRVFEQTFESVIDSSKQLDAIYVHGELVYMVMDVLKKHGIDPYEDCLLCVDYGVIRKMKDFKGIVRHSPLEEMGDLAAEMLKEQFGQKAVQDNPHRTIGIKIERRQ